MAADDRRIFSVEISFRGGRLPTYLLCWIHWVRLTSVGRLASGVMSRLARVFGGMKDL